MKSRFRSHTIICVALFVSLICGSMVVVVGCGGGAGILAGLLPLLGQQPLVAGVGVGAVFLGDEVQKPAALLPFTSEAKAIAVTSKGDKIIVSDTLHNTVTIINNQTRKVTSVLDVGTNPVFVGVTPDDQKAYVTNFGQDPNTIFDPIPGNTLSVIDLSNEMVNDPITVGKNPSAVVFTPDSSNAYVVNAFFDPDNPTNEPATVSVVDVHNDSVIHTIPLSLNGINGQSPTAASITKDGTIMFVVNRLNAGGTTGYVAVIDTISNAVVQMLEVGNNPSGIALDPEDKTAFVTNKNDNTVSVIDISGDTAVVIAELAVGQGPGPVVFSPDGQRVYVANLFGTAGIVACSAPPEDETDGDGVGQTVSVIDAQSITTLPGEIEVGIGPLGMVITDDSAKVYVISACDDIVSNFSANQITNDAAFKASQIAVPARATAVTLSSAKDEVYVAHPHAVSIIDTRTDALSGDPIPVRGSGPIALTASAAASGDSFKLFAIHPGLRSISVVEDNGSSQTLVDSISLPGRPSSITYSSDHSKLIVTLSGFSKTTSLSETLDKRVVLVDVNPVGQDDSLIANPLEVGEGPFKAVLDNKKMAYIASFGHFFPNIRKPSGEVSVLDVVNNTLAAGNPVTDDEGKIILDLIYDESNDRLYVADTTEIQSFDPADINSGSTHSTESGETDLPVDLALTTDTIYAIDYNVTNNVALLRPFNLSLIADTTVELPGPNPSKLQIGSLNGTDAAFILHAGDRSFICDQIEKKPCEIGNKLSVVDLQTGDLEQIDVGDHPTDIAFATVNGTDLVLVSSYFEGTVTVIDQASIDFDQTTVVVSKPPFFVGSGPSDILVRGDTAYVANSIANDIAVIQLSDNLSSIRVENIIDLE